MAKVIIIGDGPAGLSAALFLAKNEHAVVVFGQNDTAMHYALLRNYLGVDELAGSEFQERARRQVAAFGADLRDEEVTDVRPAGDGFVVTTADGTEERGDYLVLAAGKKGTALAKQVGIETGSDGVEVDTEYRTSVDKVYALGRLARPERSQAIISAGAGATAALDILSREAGKDVHDWDSPSDD